MSWYVSKLGKPTISNSINQPLLLSWKPLESKNSCPELPRFVVLPYFKSNIVVGRRTGQGWICTMCSWFLGASEYLWIVNFTILPLCDLWDGLTQCDHPVWSFSGLVVSHEKSTIHSPQVHPQKRFMAARCIWVCQCYWWSLLVLTWNPMPGPWELLFDLSQQLCRCQAARRDHQRYFSRSKTIHLVRVLHRPAQSRWFLLEIDECWRSTGTRTFEPHVLSLLWMRAASQDRLHDLA